MDRADDENAHTHAGIASFSFPHIVYMMDEDMHVKNEEKVDVEECACVNGSFFYA